MKTIIIVLCILIVGYFLQKMLAAIFIIPIVSVEFKEYKLLTYQFSNQRLETLQKNTHKAIKRIKGAIAFDERKINKLASLWCNIIHSTIAFDEADTIKQKVETQVRLWQRELNKDKNLLSKFQTMLEEIERERSARAFFNAQR